MKENNNEKDLLRKTARWAILFGASIFTASVLIFLVYQTYFVEDSWLIKNISEHFAAAIGLPMAGIASLCVVLVLEFSSGPIELQALGVKFKVRLALLSFGFCVLALYRPPLKFFGNDVIRKFVMG